MLFADSCIALGAWSNLVITDMRGQARREHMAEIAKCFREVHKGFPNGLAALSLIPSGVPAGDAATRTEATKLLDAFSGILLHASIVLEGSGIWAGTMRTVLRGMTIVAKTPYALKVHDDVESAARALAPLIADGGSSERAVVDVVRQFRRANARPNVVNG